MKEGWMKNDEGRMNEEWWRINEGWMKNDVGWRMKDDDFKLLRGFDYGLTDICEYRVDFATENHK